MANVTMNVTLPAPMVDDDVDLRSYDFMPLKVAQLRNSDLAAEATGDEFRAAVLLWASSWHEVPASSLPNDDKKLCRLAGLHRDLALWETLKAGAMRGFELCSDGRFYHPIIADLANAAWQKKKRDVARTANATSARLRARAAQEERNALLQQRNDAKNGTKGEGEGEGEEREKEREMAGAALPVARDDADVAVTMWNRMAARWPAIPKALTKLSVDRRTRITARLLKDLDGLEGWQMMLDKIEASPHLRGENDRGWSATLDWVTQPKNLTKIMEGNYADRPGAHRKGSFAGVTEAFARGIDPGEPDLGS